MIKKQLTAAALGLLLVATVAGCGKQKAKDIVVADLKTVCDHVDAMEIVVDEIARLVGDAGTPADLNDQQRADLDVLNAKGEEISDAMRKVGERKDAEACGSYERFKEKGMKLKEFLD